MSSPSIETDFASDLAVEIGPADEQSGSWDLVKVRLKEMRDESLAKVRRRDRERGLEVDRLVEKVRALLEGGEFRVTETSGLGLSTTCQIYLAIGWTCDGSVFPAHQVIDLMQQEVRSHLRDTCATSSVTIVGTQPNDEDRYTILVTLNL